MMSIKDWSPARIIIGVCLLLFVLGIGGIGALTFGIFSLLKSSDAYTTGLQQVQSNAEVKNLIGTPVEPGFWLTGSINVSGSSGSADISFPVSGPKGSGLAYVIGTKSEGVWQYSAMSFVLDASKQRINLLTDNNNQPIAISQPPGS